MFSLFRSVKCAGAGNEKSEEASKVPGHCLGKQKAERDLRGVPIGVFQCQESR